MRSTNDRSSVPNIFSPEFLEAFNRREEVHTSDEAQLGGSWKVRPAAGGFGVFRGWEEQDKKEGEGDAPEGVFRTLEQALLAAAVMPGVGREPLYFLNPEEPTDGYNVETVWGDGWVQVVGHLRIYEPKVVAALHVVEMMVRSPESLANVLEAAGATALELAGRIFVLPGRRGGPGLQAAVDRRGDLPLDEVTSGHAPDLPPHR